MKMTETGKALVDAGIELYAIILIGLAGKTRSEEHARATAKIINDIKPQHLAAMTYTPVPGTPLYKDIEEGKFQVLTDTEGLQETKWLMEGFDDRHMHFTSSHVSNRINLDGDIMTDREKMLKQLEDGMKAASAFGRPPVRYL
jgi:radical SAM superfamily enzyme YgiQ (UPF0313 family)